VASQLVQHRETNTLARVLLLSPAPEEHRPSPLWEREQATTLRELDLLEPPLGRLTAEQQVGLLR